jgi:hypothetical protein
LVLVLLACAPGATQESGSGASSGTGGDLIDHGGPVMASSSTTAIWWGPQSAFPPGAMANMESFLSGLQGSAMLSLTDQYMRGSTASSSFAGTFYDPSSPPPAPGTGAVAAEICSVLQANRLSPDGRTVYLVYASVPPESRRTCAWHSWGTCGGVTIRFALMLNAGGTECEMTPRYTCSRFPAATLSLASFTAHELLETLTDPGGNAWRDADGEEIGDKCQAERGCTLVGGTWYELQQQWSNALHRCALP